MKHRCHNWMPWTLSGLLLSGLATPMVADDASFAPFYERLYRESEAALHSNPTNVTAAWQFARACFDWAEFASNDTQRATIARRGIEAARTATRLSPDEVAGHYYLGLNLGQLAQTLRLSALGLVDEMEGALKKARELDAQFDFAGPDRCLGLLYRDAPGWPISVGSRSKARQHLERARELAGDYPDNQLNMLESWLKWGDEEKVRAALQTVESVLEKARKTLTGERWGTAWADWEKRWLRIQAKVAESIERATSPRGALWGR